MRQGYLVHQLVQRYRAHRRHRLQLPQHREHALRPPEASGRKGAQTIEPFSPGRLHDALRKGQDSLSQRLSRMELSLDSIVELLRGAQEAPADAATVRSRIDDILRAEP